MIISVRRTNLAQPPRPNRPGQARTPAPIPKPGFGPRLGPAGSAPGSGGRVQTHGFGPRLGPAGSAPRGVRVPRFGPWGSGPVRATGSGPRFGPPGFRFPGSGRRGSGSP